MPRREIVEALDALVEKGAAGPHADALAFELKPAWARLGALDVARRMKLPRAANINQHALEGCACELLGEGETAVDAFRRAMSLTDPSPLARASFRFGVSGGMKLFLEALQAREGLDRSSPLLFVARVAGEVGLSDSVAQLATPLVNHSWLWVQQNALGALAAARCTYADDDRLFQIVQKDIARGKKEWQASEGLNAVRIGSPELARRVRDAAHLVKSPHARLLHVMAVRRLLRAGEEAFDDVLKGIERSQGSRDESLIGAWLAALSCVPRDGIPKAMDIVRTKTKSLLNGNSSLDVVVELLRLVRSIGTPEDRGSLAEAALATLNRATPPPSGRTPRSKVASGVLETAIGAQGEDQIIERVGALLESARAEDTVWRKARVKWLGALAVRHEERAWSELRAFPDSALFPAWRALVGVAPRFVEKRVPLVARLLQLHLGADMLAELVEGGFINWGALKSWL